MQIYGKNNLDLTGHTPIFSKALQQIFIEGLETTGGKKFRSKHFPPALF